MTRLAITAWLLASALLVPARAQEGASFVDVELRVTATRPGIAVVDRGLADGLALGDRVLFRPRGDRVYEGRVVEIDQRSATVELAEASFLPAPGMRAEVSIPAERTTPVAEEPAPATLPEHPPWENEDETWEPGDPLLAKVDALRPEQRDTHISGRAYAIADQIWTSESDRSDAFYRTGFDVLYENPFGRGDGIHFDGELNYRSTDVPEGDDDDGTRFRLDRLSYYWGGHRYAAQRWELGRFLQDGMPEFGELDGVEWSQRTRRGHRFGASVGMMPEPDADHDTGDDLQVAAWYRWVADESERLSATAGYQKTFHDFDADRDLVVTRLDYLPIDGWTVHGTAWIDFYTSGDDAKGAGLGLTQAYVSAGPKWEREDGYTLTYQHQAFPEIDREEFTPIAEDELADDRNDRLALRAWFSPATRARVLTEVGGWVDEHDSGADLEVGLECDDFLLAKSRTTLSAFGAEGRFSTVLGGRLVFGTDLGSGRLDLGYELTQQDQAGFTDDNDDFLQHRYWASFGLHTTSAWSFSTYAQGVTWDDENSIALGIYLQRSF